MRCAFCILFVLCLNSKSKERKVKQKHPSKENSTIENITKKEERKKEIKEDARIIIQETNKESSVKDHERKNAVREKTRKENQINYNEEKEEQKQNLPQGKKENESKKKVQKKPEKETFSEQLTKFDMRLLNRNNTEIIKTAKYTNPKELKTFENVDVSNKNKTLHSNEFFVDKIMDNNNAHCEEKKIDDHDKTKSSRKKAEEIKRDTNIVESKSFEYEKHNEIEAIIENKSKENTNVDEMVKDTQDILFKNSKNNIAAEKLAEIKQFDDPLNPFTSKSLQKTESLEDVKEPRKDENIEQNGLEELGKNPKFVEVTSISRTKKRKLSDEERNGKEIREIKIKIRKIDHHGSNEKLDNLMSEKSQKDSDANEARITKRRYERTTAKNREVNENKQVPASSVSTTTRNRNNTRKAKQQTETILRAKDVLQEQLEYVEKPAEKIPEDPEWNVTEALSPEKSPKNVLFECHADKRADHNENDGLTGSVSERQKTSRLKPQAPAVTKTATISNSSKLKRRNSKSRRTVDHFSSSDDDAGSQTRKTFLNIFRNNAVETKQAAGQINLSPPPPRSSEPQRNKETTKKKGPQDATSNNSIVSAASILGATEMSKATILAPPTPDHAIFHSEPNNPHKNTELPSFSTPQDKKYNDIDSRLQSMFQSPNHATGHLTAVANIMYSPTHVHEINSESAKVSNTLLSPSVVVTPPAIVTTNTSPLLSQSLLNDLSVSLNVSETLKDDSILAEQQLNASLLNISNKSEGSCFETKCLSLGNSEYRIEKISANVSKVFIKRKRHKKKNKVD